MKFLLINHYAGSLIHGMEYRPFYLARELVRLGHEVTIAAASYSHLRTRQPQVQGQVLTERIEGVRYLWFRTPTYSGNGVRRAINIFAFVSQLFRHRHLLADTEPNIVVASSTYPLDAVPASSIARACGARLIFEIHDLWPLSPIELGPMSPVHPFIALMQWAENFAYCHSDLVVSLLPNAESHARTHGLPPGRFFHVPNGIYPPEWGKEHHALPQAHLDAIGRRKAQGAFLIGYAGSHGIANALDPIIQAAKILRDAPITFVLVGGGPEKARLMALASELCLTNIEFLPAVPKPAVPALLESMDCLLNSFQRRGIYRFGISPNKLFDYMMAAKPVIQAVEAANDLVRESGCGISVRPEDPEEIAGAALQMMKLSDSQRLEMGRRGSSYVLAHHDYRILAAQFLAITSAEVSP